MKKIIIAPILFILLLASCNGNSTQNESTSGQISVAASFYPMYFFTKAIGGDQANVVNITPAGAEPHEFEPSVQDRIVIEKSKMFVMNGGVEPWGEKLISELDQKGITTVIAGKNAINRALQDGWTNKDEMFTGLDPHIWLSPKRAMIIAKNILDGYLKADPKNATTYEANSAALSKEIDSLDRAYNDTLKNCERRDIVTSHAAFGYIATDYGLNQIALSGISPEAEPSAKTIAEVVDIVREKHIPVIFSETLVSPKLSETVARETGARILILNPLEGLTSQELAAGDDYLSVMRSNLSMLGDALGCKK